MVAQGAADYPASYTQYTLTDSNGAVLVDEFGALVDGVLYADGCSAIVSLTPGATYHLAQRTILQKGVQLLLTKNLNTVVIMTSIVPSAVAATTNIYVKPSQLDDFTRVSAVVAGALRAHDMTSMSGTTWLYPSDQCPGGGSCVIQGEAYYGQNQYGQSDTYSKVIVAHELGHVYQDLLTGLPATAGVVDSVAPLCRCDHVTDPSASSHCLQSRHSGSLPMVEGFAHFFAAKTFNWQSESNCTFPYYKEFVTADNIVHSPPYAIDCDAQTQWMQSYCVQSGDGVEMDWMQFFWSLTRPAAGATTIPDLDDIYFRACNNAECDGSKEVDYEDVRTAAQGHFQGSLQKYDYFVAKADQHGVDH